MISAMGQCMDKERSELLKQLSVAYSNCQMNEFDNLSVDQLRTMLDKKKIETQERKRNEAVLKRHNLSKRYDQLVLDGIAPIFEEGRYVAMDELENLVLSFQNRQTGKWYEYRELWQPLYIQGFASKPDFSLSYPETKKIVETARARQLLFIERTITEK